MKKRSFKKYIPVLLVCSFLLLDLLAMVLMTVFQTSYVSDSPEEAKVYELFSDADLQGTSYYINGVGDIEDKDSELTKLLSSTTVKKQDKLKSYILLFTLGKNDFVLYGKTVYQTDDGADGLSSVKVFEKNNTVYVVLFDESEENFLKEEFSVYLIEDENFANQILKYKASDNKYYVYSPAWVNHLMRFNLTGKMFVLVVFLETVAVFVAFKIMKGKKTAPNKKKK